MLLLFLLECLINLVAKVVYAMGPTFSRVPHFVVSVLSLTKIMGVIYKENVGGGGGGGGGGGAGRAYIWVIQIFGATNCKARSKKKPGALSV